MILQKVYKNGRLGYRGYMGGKIAWDQGMYMRAYATAAALGFTMALMEKPLNIQMCASANAVLKGCAIIQSYCEAEMKAEGKLAATVEKPDVQEPEKVQMSTGGVLQAFAFGYTYGIVYADLCHAEAEFTGIAMPHTAELIYSMGVAIGESFGIAMPVIVEMLDILLSAESEGSGIATAEAQSPENVIAVASAELTSFCCPITLPVYNVTFMHDSVELYSMKVLEGYECPDPVATGIIDTPTKETTPQYTYEHSGWSLTDGGEAINGGVETVLSEQEFSFAENPEFGGLFYAVASGINLNLNDEYVVIWDGAEYKSTAVYYPELGGNGVGNAALLGVGDDTGEPFAIGSIGSSVYIFSSDKAESHKVSICKVTPGVLSCITGNTVLYAAFEESIRYYTVEFYDDGTVMTTQSLPYGETPEYTPTKKGYLFEGWTPDIAPVTEDAVYTAKWKQLSAFADASWEEIALAVKSGTHNYGQGSKKMVTLTKSDGTTEDVEFQLVGTNHDDLADGSGKAGLTLVSVNALAYFTTLGIPSGTNYSYGNGWSGHKIREQLHETTFKMLPSDLQAVIKPVIKKSASSNALVLEETTDYLWIPSLTEYGLSATYTVAGQGSTYGYWSLLSIFGGDGKKAYSQSNGTISTSYVYHATRSAYSRSSSLGYCITSAGKADYNGCVVARIGFCI